MVRVPCCEQMGMKKGPWTPEEDQILISYIQRYGHGNWRALPKLAGLSRCGKSCRLRWINYLRPDIKRGNFTIEEEETILKLHQALGNRWSAIAARLPGRTDNEIKNYWNGHLKKKLKQRLNTTIGVGPTNQKETMEARMAVYHQVISDDQTSSSLQPSISARNSLESTCLPTSSSSSTATNNEQSKELVLITREQQGGVEPVRIDQFHFSYVSLLKNLNMSNNIDANRDFWYKLFMENSNEFG